MVELTEGVTRTPWTDALDAVFAHHDALRMQFEHQMAPGASTIPGRPATVLQRRDLSALDSAQQASMMRQVTQDVDAGFDLSRARCCARCCSTGPPGSARCCCWPPTTWSSTGCPGGSCWKTSPPPTADSAPGTRAPSPEEPPRSGTGHSSLDEPRPRTAASTTNASTWLGPADAATPPPPCPPTARGLIPPPPPGRSPSASPRTEPAPCCTRCPPPTAPRPTTCCSPRWARY